MSMNRKWLDGPRLLGALVIITIAGAVWFLLREPAIPVDLATVSRGPMAVSIDDLGETRVRDLYTVSSPVSGELLRITLKPGAAVVQGRTVVAEVQPMQPGPIDSRSYSQSLATISGLEAQTAAAGARVREAQASAGLATADMARVSKLVAQGFVTQARLDQARAELLRSRAAVAEAAQAHDAAKHALQAAKAALGDGSGAPAGRLIRITAPVTGTVLRVLQESRRPVAAGTALLELGDPDRLEIVADLLSADAVRVRPGAAALIEAWGGERPLRGIVRVVEPFGFTKVSALGVEEQRVNVTIDLTEPRVAWQRLGHGYRVTVHIAQWSAPDVLQVPLGALFRKGSGWAAYVVDGRWRARQQAVRIGHSNDDVAEVLDGLTAGQQVIVHPTDKLSDGRVVRPGT
jgi:HlyD family secretion protein